MSKVFPGALEFERVIDNKETTPSIKLQKENYGWPIYLVRARPQIGFRVAAGCRWYTLEQALSHWAINAKQPLCSLCARTSGCNKDRARGRKMLKLLPTLKNRARGYGWFKKAGVGA